MIPFKELTLDEIKKSAPSVFTKTAMDSLSSKYVHIPTYKVIIDMINLGWKPCQAVEVKARKNAGYQKHMIKFFNPNIVINGKDGDDVYPQILMSNSHDGTKPYCFQIGLFKLVCGNGLVIMDTNMGTFNLRHMGYTFEELKKNIHNVIAAFPNIVTKINTFKKVKLTDAQMKKFAKKAIELRFGEEFKSSTATLDRLLAVERNQDAGNDLWCVLNRVQEKIINGTFTYENGTKIRKARSIKNFQQDIKINSQLWELAEELV